MKLEEIRIGDILKESLSKRLGVVTGLEGKKITLIYSDKEERKFLFSGQFELASPDEAESLTDLVAYMQGAPLKKRAKGKYRKTEDDPDRIRELLKEYVTKRESQNPEETRQFIVFWNELMEAIGDKPGSTWGMRASAKWGPSPVLLVKSRKSDKAVHCAYVFAGPPLRIEVKRDYLFDKYADLFPKKKTMFTACNSVEIPYDEIGEKRQAYLGSLREILKSPR